MKNVRGNTGGRSTDKLIRILRIISVIFMAGMVIATIVILKVNHINLKNADVLSQQLNENISGGLFMVALFIILFSIGKSFALVFPPAVIFAVTGLCFGRENYAWALLVNVIATALSLVIPYFLGKFTGKEMVDSLKKKFKKIEKLDEFADRNDFALVLIVKASGMLPCDVSSLLFGAMNLNFKKYFIAANLGMLLLNVAWTSLAAFGDIKNPVSWLIVFPVLLISVIPVSIMKIREKKKAAANNAGKDNKDE